MVLARQTYKLYQSAKEKSEIQEIIDKNEEELEQVKQDAQAAVDKSDQITSDLEQTNSKIDQVKIEIDTNIGTINTDIHAIYNNLKAPNIINNPEPMFELKDNPYSQNSQNESGWAKMDSRVNNKAIIPVNMQMFNATQGKKYTEQVEIETDGVLNSLTFSFYTQTNNTHNTVDATIKSIGPGKYIVYATWIANISSLVRTFSIKDISFTGSYIKFRHPKFEEGDYTPYYLDGNFTAEAIKRVEQTSDGLIAEVSSMQVSNPNLLGEKEPMVQLRSYPGDATSTNENGWAKFNNTCQNKEILPSTDIWLDVVENKRYTQQIEVQTDGKLRNLSFTFFTKDGTHNEVIANIKQQSNNSWVAYGTWDCTANRKLRCIDIKSMTIEGGTYVQFRHPKIEEGDYTPYSMKDTIQGLENNVSRLELTTTGMQSTVTNNKDKITQITQTVDGINSRVEGLGYNENLFQSEKDYLNTTYWQVVNKQNWENPIVVHKDMIEFYKGKLDLGEGINVGLSYKIFKKPLEIGKKYTISFEVYIPPRSEWDKCGCRFFAVGEGGNGTPNLLEVGFTTYWFEKNGDKEDTWKKVYKTFSYRGNFTGIGFFNNNKQEGQYPVKIRNIKLEEGDVATGMESIPQKITQITQTIDGVQTTVQDNTGKITQVTQTIDGLNSKVQDNTGRLTEVTQNIDGLSSRVEENTTALEGDPNLIGSFKTTPTMINTGNHFGTRSTDANGWANFGGSSFASKTINASFESKQPFVKKKDNQQLTLSFRVNTNCDLFGENCYLKVKLGGQEQLLTLDDIIETKEAVDVNKPESQCREYKLKYTFIPESDFEYPIILAKTVRKLNESYNAYSHVAFRDFQIVEGTEPKPYVVSTLGLKFSELKQTVDGFKTTVANQQNQMSSITQSVQGIQATVNDNENKIGKLTLTSQNLQSDIIDLTNNTSSKITQLSNNLNLKVSKGEVVSQINLSPDNVWIDGKKVKITGETYIQDGVIKDAKIGSLSVDKLTGNKASFIQKGLDGETGSRVQITGSGIKFSGRPYTSDYDNNYVEVNSGHLKFWAGGGAYSDSYGYIGTAKRGSFLTVTAGVVKGDDRYDRSPALALRSSGQDVFVATRKSVALSGGTVYIGNNTAAEDGYNIFYDNVYEATSDGQITNATTTRVAIGAQSEIWARTNGKVILETNEGVNLQYSHGYNSEKDIRFYYEGKFGYGMNAPGLYKRTSSGSANLTITSSYNIMKTSSARKYKTAIKEIDNLEEAKKMLEISPISWIDKAEAREKGMKNCDRYVGFLADDFDDAGLTEVVDYDQDGEVESLAYDRLSVYMIQLIKDLYKKVEALEK